MKIKRITVGLYGTNCYIVDTDAGLFIIDPGDEFDKIKKYLPREPKAVFFTHLHFDHIGAASLIYDEFPETSFFWGEHENRDPDAIADIARKAMGPYFEARGMADKLHLPEPAGLLKDGQIIDGFTVMHTPGHTGGSVCLYLKEENILFSGDTLFCRGFGRTDLGGSDKDIFESIKKIMTLPDCTVVYPGHGFSTTIAEEKQNY